jgi:hypothetical protein
VCLNVPQRQVKIVEEPSPEIVGLLIEVASGGFDFRFRFSE